MTEEQWDTEKNPFFLLAALLGMEGLSRKRRLAICGCCRVQLGSNLAKYGSWIEVAERCADGLIAPEEREAIRAEILDRHSLARDTQQLFSTAFLADASNGNLRGAIRLFVGSHRAADRALTVCHLFRDIFGNPFRPVAFDPAWRTEHTVGMAAKMYDDRDFAAMPILADALEEAGCDSADILSHCREPGVHVRGCWVVDHLLGKS